MLLLGFPHREVGDVSQRFARQLAPNHYTARSARGRTDPMTIPAVLELKFAAGDPPGDDPSRGAQRQHPAGDPGSGGRTSGGVSADFPWIYWKTGRPSIAPEKPLRALSRPCPVPESRRHSSSRASRVGRATTRCAVAGVWSARMRSSAGFACVTFGIPPPAKRSWLVRTCPWWASCSATAPRQAMHTWPTAISPKPLSASAALSPKR